MSRPAPEVVTPHLLRDWPLPDLQADKESRGRVLVVGGSRDTPGAVRLAVEAALRVGAGKVQVVTVRSAATALAVAMPEAMVRGVAEGEDGELTSEAVDVVARLAPECEAVLLGPGMGDPGTARELVAAMLAQIDTSVVLDALGLAAVTDDDSCLSHLAGRALLTPNVRELALTLGWETEKVVADPREAALRLAARTGVCVSGGGAVTWTAHPDGRSWRGSVGGPGLGTAGSGDVKAGVVAGLLGRGAEPAQAAVWGSHLHGSAGDRLTAELGATGFLARELSQKIPQVLAELDA
ncbi:NAD(P)H-hydrate dehydratase [Ornithinimicrobium cerasi]|uniref:ADP-dependent (S)-NAD(P)H-hydrate dehydratase n=1 Tax=Ornithinimicrobium cerasi TaxID=2248773 RepID=A0A285VHZ7_9MICO|nr:NAD(P)H-hydrate dehydratase [Ornithinimicrobium cerasi]SOC53507.1 yjeF C-terminal region, hydroxyethylthiazole kinase-related [Ornithinimicrobium cerasi]